LKRLSMVVIASPSFFVKIGDVDVGHAGYKVVSY
jgi:hypothetical protein